MASIQDVANRAHVGTATVSRVLSGKGYVAEKTRNRVLKAIDELNYVPNELARNLLHNRTKTIAVIVPDMSNPFFAMLINEIEIALRQSEYQTLLCNTTGEPKNELLYLNMLERNMVDGIITASHLLLGNHYARIKYPIVSIDRVMGCDIPSVCSDHAEGGRRAAELLIQAGCRNVAQFQAREDPVYKNSIGPEKYRDELVQDFPFMLRHMEFERLIREAGIQYGEYSTSWEGHFVDYRQVCRLVGEGGPDFGKIDGVLATDGLAALVLRMALSSGRRVPEDIKIVSYDGTYLMDCCYPTLSYIAQPICQIAEKAVELLMRQINGEKLQNVRKVLPINVVQGQSTGGQPAGSHYESLMAALTKM